MEYFACVAEENTLRVRTGEVQGGPLLGAEVVDRVGVI
jgi:hypothetical protein